jgi:hypothetical protein
MNLGNRRAFLKQTLGITALVAIAYQLPFSTKETLTSELLSALTVWKNHETALPQTYIDSAMTKTKEVKEIIQEEFLNKKILSVNGLVLSKFEVAFLAAIALEQAKK